MLNKDLPEMWKLAIAQKIENNLLSKVRLSCLSYHVLQYSHAPPSHSIQHESDPTRPFSSHSLCSESYIYSLFVHLTVLLPVVV